MRWNWQKKSWPRFEYNATALEKYEAKFLYNAGLFSGVLEYTDQQEKDNLRINLICDEALKTSEIEGEYLNRDSLHSSIRKNFGLQVDKRKSSPAEEGIAELMADLYLCFDKDLNHKTLFAWHSMLMNGRNDLTDIGAYRTHTEPMLIVSYSNYQEKIHFEAPPSSSVKAEMNQFIAWFNSTRPNGDRPLPALTRAAIAHLYFVSIHPFEDGNGRIARAISEKALSQALGRPTLISLSKTIEKHRKKYYEALSFSNSDLKIDKWLEYFALTILEAQEYSQKLLDLLLKKTKFYRQYSDSINPRQEKVIARIFEEGIEGFKGGLSAENYISITKTSRATATRDLQDLVEKNILTKQGELKSTRYYLAFI